MKLAMKTDTISERQILKRVETHKGSKEYQLAMKGKRYYQVDNDILTREKTRIVDGRKYPTFGANNRLAHGKYHGMVDEKVSYLLTRDYSLVCEEEVFLKRIKSIVGDHLSAALPELGYEASNTGVGWLHPYIDESGSLRLVVYDYSELIPEWADKKKRELKRMIREYTTVDESDRTIERVEVWDADGVTHFIKQNGTLILDYQRSYDANSDKVSHILVRGKHASWGRVPFIPFFNNRLALPDIKFVETQLEAYDNARSEAANYIEDVKNLVYVLKGYGGEDPAKVMDLINKHRLILIDDIEGGGVDALTPAMDITAVREHYEQLKRDITEDGQAINKDLDKFGSAPSGIALKFMYAGLDLKCNALEREFKKGFADLMEFVKDYLRIRGESVSNETVSILFNRDMEINESEVIDNCIKSGALLSLETVVANHPWTSDVEAELQRIKAQRDEEGATWDRVGDGDEEAR